MSAAAKPKPAKASGKTFKPPTKAKAEKDARSGEAKLKAGAKAKVAAKTGSKKASGKSATPAVRRAEWHLRLYVAGNTPKSVAALHNLRRVCEEHLAGRYEIEVIDLLVNPQLAAGDQILAVPTLVRKFPEPLRRIIGDLSNVERVLVGMDLKPAG